MNVQRLLILFRFRKSPTYFPFVEKRDAITNSNHELSLKILLEPVMSHSCFKK